MKTVFAFAAGCALFALPFLQSGLAESHSHAPGPHMDHDARHGGSLLMVGDFHVEVVESDRAIELYVSDAERRPLRPRSADATYDGRREGDVRWDSYRLVAPRPPAYRTAEYRIVVDGAAPIVFGWRAGSAGFAGRTS
jgi:hypothetical protein